MPKSMGGKKIGSWLGGNEPELFAALTKAGLDPKTESVTKQDFDMNAFVQGDIDTAQAMIYNEYAQVLETKNPKTGQLFKPDDLNVIDFNDPSIGTAMLQDAIIARDAWLKKPGNEDIAVKFLKASFKGWEYCRDNYQKCADLVVKAGSELKTGHQTWMMNEINGLIWPSPNGIGQFDQAAWDNTVNIATTYGVLKAQADGRGVPHRSGQEGARRARDQRGHQGRELQARDRDPDRGRQLAGLTATRPDRNGRPDAGPAVLRPPIAGPVPCRDGC